MMSRYTDKAKSLLESSEKRREQAFAAIPSEYHSFIVMMSEQEIIGPANELTQEELDSGIMLMDHKACVPVSKPYMMVDGRVKWARDEHRTEGKKLFIHSPIVSNDGSFLTVHVESEWLGSSSGSSTIPTSNEGFAATSAIEMAQTSALGRALGFLGYGLIGGGFITAEEKEGKDQLKETSSKPSTGQADDRSSSSTQAQKDSTKPELNYVKFRLEEKPTINADGTSHVTGMLQNRSIIDVLFPKNLLSHARELNAEQVVVVLGYVHENVVRVQRFSTEADQKAQAAG